MDRGQRRTSTQSRTRQPQRSPQRRPAQSTRPTEPTNPVSRKCKKNKPKNRWIIAIIVLILIVIFGSTGDDTTTAPNTVIEPTAIPVDQTSEPQTSATADSVMLTTEDDEIIPTPVATQAPTLRPTEVISKIPENSTFKIAFLDVGQADAAVVECDGHYLLVDGGNKADSSLIYSFLKNYSIDHLDMVIATHAHEDHVGGIPGAFNYASADLTLCPVDDYDSDAFADFVKYATQNGNGITVPSVGDTYRLGSSTITILGLNVGTETNDSSIVFKLEYGDTSFLFTGDAEREAEQAILNAGSDLSATVLKVGHHGSDTSTTYPFLREIMPQYAVISVGADNLYDHPTDDTLSRLRDADVTVYRTDLHGDILITSDGETVTVSTEKRATDAEIMTPGGKIVTLQPVIDSELAEAVGVNYIANKNTKKFHYTDCSSVAKMKESNKLYFTGTRDELISKGYDPCGNCKP